MHWLIFNCEADDDTVLSRVRINIGTKGGHYNHAI